MLGIRFLCEGQNSTCSHWHQCVYFSRSSHWCWACCTKKLFSTCGVKILEKYLWRCTFFSTAACWRPEALLKLTLLQVILKDFAHKYTEQLQILEKLFEEHFFCRTLRADFFYLSNHLRKFWEYFNSILTSYCTASVTHCMLFPLTLKKTGLAIYIYIWPSRNCACILKHKQTWPEEAVC